MPVVRKAIACWSVQFGNPAIPGAIESPGWEYRLEKQLRSLQPLVLDELSLLIARRVAVLASADIDSQIFAAGDQFGLVVGRRRSELRVGKKQETHQDERSEESTKFHIGEVTCLSQMLWGF